MLDNISTDSTGWKRREKAKDYAHLHDCITVTGAREHNLKSVNVRLPKQKLIVFTGVSGSGKSSLAFDTIFAEGQRRYIESLSSYARQFLGQLEKPDFDSIRGLSPTISIEQKSTSKNPRSTVGTITEIYDYLRVLFARIGAQYCCECSKPVGKGSAQSMVHKILDLPVGTKIMILAPLVKDRKGEHKEVFLKLKRDGFARARINGVVSEIENVQSLAKNKKHTIEVLVDRLVVKNDKEFRTRAGDSVETALKQGKGAIILHVVDQGESLLSEHNTCCGIGYETLEPGLFSFNSPKGMCLECNGIGQVMTMDEDKLIPDKTLSIREGAILPWRSRLANQDRSEDSFFQGRLDAFEKQLKINLDKPWQSLPANQKKIILWGANNKALTVKWKGKKSEGSWVTNHEGLIPSMLRRFKATQSESMKEWYGKFMSEQSCGSCNGKRLRKEILAVKVKNHNIQSITKLTVAEIFDFISELKLTASQKIIGSELLKEIRNRLSFLLNVGLDYLSLDRRGPTLSGGEAQRIRLASQIGSELTGVLYVLDEPSIGLHQRDNVKLLDTLQRLRDIGNTLIVVEHDEETIAHADWLVDFGPGAGQHGGEIVAEGSIAAVKGVKKSLTGQYLAGKRTIEIPPSRRTFSPKSPQLKILAASENNLRDVDAKIPLGSFCVVTGVSGAGKSTLVNQILSPAASRYFYNGTDPVGRHKKIEGFDLLDKVINIDQKPIGRTPRSNPATYTKVFDLIRDFFAMLPESEIRGYDKGRFSFNVKGGRCETCCGDGHIIVEMHFLSDVYVPCEDCKGRRFQESTLEIKYKGKSIADVLELSVGEACELFAQHPRILAILKTLMQVGLSYVKLGQPATTLSGGEAQRIKLARELAKTNTGKTLYILDEPTTGLHFEDIRNLLQVLHHLVNLGNTVLVVEHNLDIIKTADWIIDLGPEGGDRGGQIIAEGTPEHVAQVKASYTGQFLKKILSP
ncbi:MAG: excinuclease ABC subunit UvrA [Oligoflexales bacterium]